MNCYLFLFLLHFVNSKNISPKTLCRDCKYFIPTTVNFEYSLGDSHGKCEKYLRHNNIYDEEPDHEFAIYVRDDINKCGKEGVYFSKKPMSVLNIFPNVFPE